MTVISKEVFYAASGPKLSCQALLHPAKGCTKALFDFMVQMTIGSSKFFLIIYLLQTITTWNKINKSFINSQIRSYIRSVAYALGYSSTFHSSICLLRWWLDEFQIYAVALSGLIGAFALFIEDEKQRSLDTAIYFNLVMETLLRYLYIEKYVKRTALKETLLFMTFSGVLMYFLKRLKPGAKVANLWFYYPSQPKPAFYYSKTKDHCTHDCSCSIFFYEGFSRYFLVGYMLQLLKYILPRLDKIFTNPMEIIKSVVSKNKFLFGLMLGSYVGIYRIVSCLLYKKDKGEKPWHSLLGGFFAGSAYLFKPTSSILAIAVTTTLQALIQQIPYLNNIQSKVPAREIIFAICSGFIFHARFLYPETCPKYVNNMFNVVSNKEVNRMCSHAMLTLEDLGKSVAL